LDDITFAARVKDLLQPNHQLLDLGAGAGVVPQLRFRGVARRVCGVDPDPRVLENPNLDDAKVGDAENIPFPDESFDIVISTNVLEHLPDPAKAFLEVARVLKPGGIFLVKTPNWWNYMPPLAMITPVSLHDRLNPKPGGDEEDSFPVLYRANTSRSIRRYAAGAGMRLRSVRMIDGRAGYLTFNALAYFLGWIYHWMVTRVPGLDRFSICLIAEMERLPRIE